MTPPEPWSLWFTKGWEEAVIEWAHSPIVRAGIGSIIFCTSLPATLSPDQVEEFKSGVIHALGDRVQFLIEAV